MMHEGHHTYSPESVKLTLGRLQIDLFKAGLLAGGTFAPVEGGLLAGETFAHVQGGLVAGGNFAPVEVGLLAGGNFASVEAGPCKYCAVSAYST